MPRVKLPLNPQGPSEQQPNNSTTTKMMTMQADNERSCAICLEDYSNNNDDTCVFKSERVPSAACDHGLCLQCVISHVIAYHRDFCPLCRREGAFDDASLHAHILSRRGGEDTTIPASIEPLIANALDTRVRETLLYPCIERMTEMLAAGEASSTATTSTTASTAASERQMLPSLRISPRHVLSTCAVLRRDDAFEATFALTSQDSDETLYFRAEHAPGRMAT